MIRLARRKTNVMRKHMSRVVLCREQWIFTLGHLSRAQFRLNKSPNKAEACDTCCNRTVAGQEWMNDFVHSLKKLKLKYWTLPCQERVKFGAGDPVICKTANFIPVLTHGACVIMRVSVVPRKLMLLIGKDTLKEKARFDLQNNIGNFPGARIVRAECCEKAEQVPWWFSCCLNRFGSSMIRLLHQRLRDPWVFSTSEMYETFPVIRLPRSRTTLEGVTSKIAFFDVCVRKEPLWMPEYQTEEETMESDVMDAESSLHQKPLDVCAIEEVMCDEGSLHQKTNENCNMADAESIDLVLFENTKLNRLKNGTRCSCGRNVLGQGAKVLSRSTQGVDPRHHGS